jgi:hypothetical protein
MPDINVRLNISCIELTFLLEVNLKAEKYMKGMCNK